MEDAQRHISASWENMCVRAVQLVERATFEGNKDRDWKAMEAIIDWVTYYSGPQGVVQLLKALKRRWRTFNANVQQQVLAVTDYCIITLGRPFMSRLFIAELWRDLKGAAKHILLLKPVMHTLLLAYMRDWGYKYGSQFRSFYVKLMSSGYMFPAEGSYDTHLKPPAYVPLVQRTANPTRAASLKSAAEAVALRSAASQGLVDAAAQAAAEAEDAHEAAADSAELPPAPSVDPAEAATQLPPPVPDLIDMLGLDDVDESAENPGMDNSEAVHACEPRSGVATQAAAPMHSGNPFADAAGGAHAADAPAPACSASGGNPFAEAAGSSPYMVQCGAACTPGQWAPHQVQGVRAHAVSTGALPAGVTPTVAAAVLQLRPPRDPLADVCCVR